MPAPPPPSKRRAARARLACTAALALLACACDRFVVIGGYGDGGLVSVDGGSDAGAPDGGRGDGGEARASYTLGALVIEPARVTAGQPGVTLRFDVTNPGALPIVRVDTTFEVGGVPAPSEGVALMRAAGESTAPIAAGETRALRYDVTLAAEGAAAARGRKTILVSARAFAAAAAGVDGGVVALGAGEPATLGGELVIDARPAPLVTARVVGGALALYLGESVTVSIEVANTGDAELVLDVGAPSATARDAAGNAVAGVAVTRVDASPQRLAGGARVTLAHTLRVETSGATLGAFALRVCAGGRDANYLAAGLASPTYLSCAGDSAFDVRGAPPLVLRSVATDRGVVTLGQREVLVRVALENSGSEPLQLADCTDALRLPNENCNPRVRFLAAGGAAGESPLDVTDFGFVFGGFTPPPGGAVIGRAETLRLTAAFHVRASDDGQVGRNVVMASAAYTRAGGAVRGVVPAALSSAELWVVFRAGPVLDAPYGAQPWSFGAAIAGLGDVEYEASPWPGLAVGAPSWDSGAGAVYVYQLIPDASSQRQPLLVRQSFGFAQHHLGAALAAVGNWNRDGLTDRSNEVAIGRPGASYFALYDVDTGVFLDDPFPASFTPCAPGCELGAALAANPRGRNEPLGESVPLEERRIVAVGAPGDASGAGRVDVLRQRLSSEPRPPGEPAGTTAHTRIDGEAGGERFGAALALADVDGDGDFDLLAGAPGFRRGGDVEPRGRVHVVRAPTFTRGGAAWSTLEGEAPGDAFGASVSTLGDVDGDGHDDFAVGAPAANGGAGRVYVFSGATGQRLYALEGRTYSVTDASGATTQLGERFGASLASLYRPRAPAEPASDFNQDGLPDFAVGAPLASPRGKLGAGAVYVFSAPRGADGRAQALLVYHGAGAGDAFGSALTPAGDIDADGFQDLVVGAPSYTSPTDPLRVARGRVYVVTGGAARTVPVGGGL